MPTPRSRPIHATAVATARAVATFALIASSAAAQQPVEIVRRALDAIGGADAVRALPGVALSSYSVAYALGQSELPDSPPRASVSIGRNFIDWRRTRRAVIVETHTVAGAVMPQRSVVADGIGAQGATELTAPMAPNAVSAQVVGIRRAPHRILLAALDAPATLRAIPSREFRGTQHQGVGFAGADTVSLWFDRASGLLTVMEIVTDDPVLGDRVTQTFYTRWQDAGMGVRHPRQTDVRVNGEALQHLIHTAVEFTAPPDSLFAIPAVVAARAVRDVPTGPPPVSVSLVRIAPAVWRAEGQTHHTLVVEVGADRLLLVEAPQSTQRVRAVLDTLRSRFPGRTVSAVVNTHHHWDHAGGLREVIAEGIPIVTHQANEAFVRRLAIAPRTRVPDLQATRHRAPTVRTLTDSMVLGSGAGQVVVYRTQTAHAEGLVSVWVPSARVLFASDVLNPAPASVAPAGSAELVALARARGVAPEHYSGGHGRTVPWAEIVQAAGGVPEARP